jgi:hypothetical protein
MQALKSDSLIDSRQEGNCVTIIILRATVSGFSSFPTDYVLFELREETTVHALPPTLGNK